LDVVVSDSSVLGKFKAVSKYRRQVRSGKKVWMRRQVNVRIGNGVVRCLRYGDGRLPGFRRVQGLDQYVFT